VNDVFELQVRLNRRTTSHNTEIDIKQRHLNNAFAYDLVPSTTVITAALKAARRVNDFPTAVRIFEGMVLEQKGRMKLTFVGIKHKVENEGQYNEYLKELEPVRQELGISLQEHMYPNW